MSTDSPPAHTGAAARLLAGLATCLAATAPALAHSGHTTHTPAGGTGGAGLALPAALIGGGLLVLGTSVYLDRSGDLDGRFKDLGVLVGVVGLLAGLTLGLV